MTSTSSGICFHGAQEIRNNTTLPFCLHPRRVCVRLFQLSQKKLLGNRNRHHPGSLSGKWNPEPGSQTSNHTFVSFIHFSLGCAARKAWGRWAQTDTTMCVGKPAWLRQTCGNSAGHVFSPRAASYSDYNLKDVTLTEVPDRWWKLSAADRGQDEQKSHSQTQQQLMEVDSECFSTHSDPGPTWLQRLSLCDTSSLLAAARSERTAASSSFSGTRMRAHTGWLSSQIGINSSVKDLNTVAGTEGSVPGA